MKGVLTIEPYPKRRTKRALKGLQKPSGRAKPKKTTVTQLKKKLWELCKQITRKNCVQPDGTWICYTSKKVLVFPKDAHTGHFIPSSLCSVELRYDLKNLRVQSYDQNINKNGNPLQFERNLIVDYGQAYVDELWDRNERTKGIVYPLSWFEDKIREYESLITK